MNVTFKFSPIILPINGVVLLCVLATSSKQQILLFEMLFLNTKIFHLILNFTLVALCYVSLEAGELFGILILANFGIILYGGNFFINMYI